MCNSVDRTLLREHGLPKSNTHIRPAQLGIDKIAKKGGNDGYDYLLSGPGLGQATTGDKAAIGI